MEKIGKLFREYAENHLKKNLDGANCLFVIRYSGIKAAEMNTLRQSLKSSEATLFVLKNSISRKVFDGMGLNEFSKTIEGPCGIIYTNADAVGVSKVVHNFIKENQNLKVECGLLEDKVLTQNEITALAKLPSKEVLYAKLAGAFQSPISSMVWTLSGILKKIVYVLDQVKNKKETEKK